METKTEHVAKSVVRAILKGTLVPGERIPSEREMAQTTGSSRVTVRRAYRDLESRGILVRQPRVGTLINDKPLGSAVPLEYVAFLGTSNNLFVFQFVKALDSCLAEKDALLVLRLTELLPQREEDAAAELVAKGLRNLVLWPSSRGVNAPVFRRLRALGVNMVFVDRFQPEDYADYVGVDYRHATATLTRGALDEGCRRLVFVTHSDVEVHSERNCEEALVDSARRESLPLTILRVPWDGEAQRAWIAENEAAFRPDDPCTAVIAVNDHVAFSVYECVRRVPRLFSIGGAKLLNGTGIVSYAVPVDAMAAATVECLDAQRAKGRLWKSRSHFLQGSLLGTRIRHSASRAAADNEATTDRIMP